MVQINMAQEFCRFHGHCREKGWIKIKCKKDRCRSCKHYRKLEEDMRLVRVGTYRDTLVRSID